jgi:hypothetical protein
LLEQKGKDWRMLDVDLERHIAQDSFKSDSEPEEKSILMEGNSA